MSRPIRLDRRSRLIAAITRPDARRTLGRATALFGGFSLASVAALGALVIWHLVRRGRLIRDSQPPPRALRPPGFEDRSAETAPP